MVSSVSGGLQVLNVDVAVAVPVGNQIQQVLRTVVIQSCNVKNGRGRIRRHIWSTVLIGIVFSITEANADGRTGVADDIILEVNGHRRSTLVRFQVSDV